MNEDLNQLQNTLFLYGPRLLSAFLAGTIIGIEGEIFRRPAGLRTSILIALGTALFAIISVAVAQGYGGDPGRIAAQIVTGIGFIGAGVIMHEQGEVHGITTAATVFATAAIGVTIGFGYIYSGVLLSLVVAAILILFRPVHRFLQNSPVINRYRERELEAKRVVHLESSRMRAAATSGKNVRTRRRSRSR